MISPFRYTIFPQNTIYHKTVPVDHSILCTKLTYYGFWGSFYDLLCDYLAGHGRQQRVSFHGDLSNWGAISIGVPQGSILGPLFFALYSNDLLYDANYCMLDLYANDAELRIL